MFLFQPLGTIFYQKGRSMDNWCYSRQRLFLFCADLLSPPHILVLCPNQLFHIMTVKAWGWFCHSRSIYPFENECRVFAAFVDNVKETVYYWITRHYLFTKLQLKTAFVQQSLASKEWFVLAKCWGAHAGYTRNILHYFGKLLYFSLLSYLIGRKWEF